MIKNMWYGILDAREIRGDKPIGVTRLGEKLVLWRSQDGSISCICDQCCHRGAALSTGKVHFDAGGSALLRFAFLQKNENISCFTGRF